jgi:glycosyltransferase involved in cell wall biosynthesis
MTKPFFSIIIPTYNRAEKLKRTVSSVLAQSFKDFEVLVVDDGSRDHTEDVVRAFNDSRISYLWNENSGGPATPRNIGIKNAKGIWLCFLDADDTWSEDKLLNVYTWANKNVHLDVICHHLLCVDERTKKKKILFSGPEFYLNYSQLLKHGNKLLTSSVSVKREFVKKNSILFNQDPGFVIVEDYDFWLKCASFGGQFFLIDKVLGRYYWASDNISANLNKTFANLENVLNFHLSAYTRGTGNKSFSKIAFGRYLIVRSLREFVHDRSLRPFRHLFTVFNFGWLAAIMSFGNVFNFFCLKICRDVIWAKKSLKIKWDRNDE